MSSREEVLARKAFARAIAIFGSEEKLALAIGYAQSVVHRAKALGRASAEMAVNIEIATHGQITREQLRPDIFCDRTRLINRAWDGRVSRSMAS